MFEWLRSLVKSRDGKPVTGSLILGRDDCSRTLTEFNEKELPYCQAVVIVWQDMKGDIYAVSSDNVDEIRASGMLGKAWGKINHGD